MYSHSGRGLWARTTAIYADWYWQLKKPWSLPRLLKEVRVGRIKVRNLLHKKQQI